MKFSWPKGLAPGIKKLLSRYQYVLLVLAAGVLLLLLPLGGREKEDRAQTPAQLQEEFDLEAFEDRLAGALSQIQGAGEAQVVLTLKSGSRQVLAQDTQRGPRTPSGERTGTPAPPPSPWAGARAARRWSPSRPWPPSSRGPWWSVPAEGTRRCASRSSRRSPPSPAWAATEFPCVPAASTLALYG